MNCLPEGELEWLEGAEMNERRLNVQMESVYMTQQANKNTTIINLAYGVTLFGGDVGSIKETVVP